MFDPIAARYDLLNRVLSFGIDRHWRYRTVSALELDPGVRVLDLATGTADLAIALVRHHPQIQVLGLDPSPRMLDVARAKLARTGLHSRVELGLGDATCLDLPDGEFAATCMAFGIRNIAARGKAIREMARVTKPGGQLAILELAEPRGSGAQRLARWYVHQAVPALGAMLSRAPQYRYLSRSICAFPPADEFAESMRENHLVDVHVRPLTFGACHLYLARTQGATR